MMWQLLFLLLPCAAICGWYFAYKQYRDSSISANAAGNKIPDNYFLGLNYLIDEQPDKAVDVFINLLTADGDTVEMHLALGNLFRRKGEVDRAIKIHKNLIARSQLTKEQRNNAIAELAQDYLRAGMLDRSERLFLELVEIDKENVANYKSLSSIYEKQKDWRQAIAMAQKLSVFNKGNEKIWTPIAYYYCALSDEAREQGLMEQAEIYLKKALVQDSTCVRASIMLGELSAAAGHYKTALYFYKQVKKQDPDFLSEIALPIIDCYKKLGKEERGIAFLEEALRERYATALALFIARYFGEKYGIEKMLAFINAHDSQTPSLRITNYLLSKCAVSVGRCQLEHEAASSFNAQCQFELSQLQSSARTAQLLLEKFLQNKPYYRCINCGLGTKQLYWQCPRCKRWASLKPIRKFELE